MPPTEHVADPAVLASIQGNKRRSRVRVVVGLLLLAALVGAGGVLAWLRLRAPRYVYDTEAAVVGTLAMSVTATGTLEPRHAVDVGADISGRVKRVLVDVNDAVKQGQLLAELQTDLLDLSVKQATATVASAQASHDQAALVVADAEQALARADKLHAAAAIATQDHEQAVSMQRRAQAGLALSTANLEVARAALDAARANRAKAEIRAPIGGIVLRRNVEPGQVVISALQAQVLFRLAEDLTHLEVHADVDEADVSKVKPAQDATFTVAAEPARTFLAKVRTVASAPRSAAQVVSYQTVLDVDNPDLALRPGMTATVKIAVGQLDDAVLVPTTALRFVPPTDVAPPASATNAAALSTSPRVWVLDFVGDPVARDVGVGPSDGELTVVTGLDEGAEVVVAARKAARP